MVKAQKDEGNGKRNTLGGGEKINRKRMSEEVKAREKVGRIQKRKGEQRQGGKEIREKEREEKKT